MRARTAVQLLFGATLLLAVLQSSAAKKSHYVYTMDNQFGNNMIHAWEGTDSGSLKLLDRYPTGGSGFPRAPDGLPVSDVLASSFSVIRHENFVINVNPGSNSVSVFEIANDGRLERRSVTEIEGVFPVTLAAFNRRVCVGSVDGPEEDAGKGAYVECYRLDREDGTLRRSRRFEGSANRILGPLSGEYYRGVAGGANNPRNNGGVETPRTLSQLSFTPDGDALIAVVKAIGVFVFPIEDRGLTGPFHLPADDFRSVVDRDITNVVGDRSGAPFSFLIAKNSAGREFFAVTETLGVDGGVLTGGGVSTFRFDSSRSRPLRRQISDTVTASPNPLVTPCWIVSNGKYLWTSNAFVGTLTAFEMADNGAVSVLPGLDAMPLPVAPTGDSPNSQLATQPEFFDSPNGSLALDMSISSCGDDGEMLYVVDSGYARLVAYSVNGDGSLTLVSDPDEGIMDLEPGFGQERPLGVQGIASVCASDL